MKLDGAVDYAPMLIKVEKDLVLVHDLIKRNKHTEAAAVVNEIIVESRLLRNAIKSHAN
jgi:hypothetical protein